MSRPNSALRIFIYNWPIFAATWAACGAAVAASALGWAPAALAVLAALPVVWSSISLAVSWYVYDRSPLRHGTWLGDMLPAKVERWATVHAGLDAEVELGEMMPGTCAGQLDIFTSELMPAGSIRRARRYTAADAASLPCAPTQLALADATCDAIVVAFAAHEVRSPTVRERFFAELRRCLRAGGRIVLVEHVRDMANFLAFGPGYRHFLPRQEWLRLARGTGFGVVHEKRVTPWVMALSLEVRP